MQLPEELANQLLCGLPLDVKRWMVSVATELERAQQKHPSWPQDTIHQAAIVAEESGELVRAAINYRYENGRIFDCHKEAIQTAATCLRFLTAPLPQEMQAKDIADELIP